MRNAHPYWETPREAQFQAFVEDVEKFLQQCEEQRRRLSCCRVLEVQPHDVNPGR